MHTLSLTILHAVGHHLGYWNRVEHAFNSAA